MPSFGFTSIGTTSVSVGSVCFANIRSNERHTASSGDTITQFHIYGNDSPASTINVAAYAYDSGSNVPTTRLGSGTPIDIGTSAGWNSSGVVSISLSAGVDYCLAFETGFTVYYSSFSGNTRARHAASTLPATWVNTNYSSIVFSIYADYTTGGASLPNINGVSTYTSINGVSTFTSWNGV